MKKLQPLKIGSGWEVVENGLIEGKEIYEHEQRLLKLIAYTYHKKYHLRKERTTEISIHVYWFKNYDHEQGYFMFNYVYRNNFKSFALYSLKELVDKINFYAGYDILYPLVIPEGWIITNNKFGKPDPRYPPVEDISYFEYNNEETGVKWLMDIGFYSEENHTGNFIIQLIKNNDWHNPVVKFDTNCVDETTRIVNELFINVMDGCFR